MDPRRVWKLRHTGRFRDIEFNAEVRDDDSAPAHARKCARFPDRGLRAVASLCVPLGRAARSRCLHAAPSSSGHRCRGVVSEVCHAQRKSSDRAAADDAQRSNRRGIFVSVQNLSWYPNARRNFANATGNLQRLCLAHDGGRAIPRVCSALYHRLRLRT